MNTVHISAKLSDKKKIEFYQTMEPLENLIKNYCSNYKIVYHNGGKLLIEIVFEDHDQFETNYNKKEFNILKGSIRSLCDNVEIKINDDALN